MSDQLGEDQIAALFAAAKSGEVPDPASETGRRPPKLKTVDFSRPTKFTSDHQRRIVRTIDSFCVMAATRLTGELRAPVEFETITTTQATWLGAQGQIPAGSIAVTLEVKPLGTRLLLALEQEFVLSAVECLLGGGSDRPPKARRLSEIDWALASRLTESLVSQMSVVWNELCGISFAIEELEQHTEASNVANVSEPTLVIMLEARIGKGSTTIAMLVPWVAIDDVADRIAGREHDGDTGVDAALEQALRGAPVTLRAEVAALDLPVGEVLSLTPGTVLRLGARASDGVTLFAENVPLGRAQPGADGARRAVQIRTKEAFVA